MMMTFLADFVSLRRVVMGDVNGVGKIKQRRQGRSGVKTKRKKSTKNGLLPNGNECLHLGGPYITNHVF
jgi:hypothetical protein